MLHSKYSAFTLIQVFLRMNPYWLAVEIRGEAITCQKFSRIAWIYRDTEAVQMLRDIAAVKRVPAEKKFAEEFLMHFKSKKVDLADIPEPNGALKR